MAKINLRNFYPWYTWDEFVEVPDVIAGELFADRRYQKTHERTIRRNKVLSLDVDDGTAVVASIRSSDNPETVFEMMERHCGLCNALNSLPEISTGTKSNHPPFSDVEVVIGGRLRYNIVVGWLSEREQKWTIESTQFMQGNLSTRKTVSVSKARLIFANTN